MLEFAALLAATIAACWTPYICGLIKARIRYEYRRRTGYLVKPENSGYIVSSK